MPVDLAELLAPRSCAVLTHELQESVVGEGAALAALVAEATPTFPAVRRLLEGAGQVGVPVAPHDGSRDYAAGTQLSDSLRGDS